MSTKIPISAIILTYNEEKNIEQCILSVIEYVDEIHVLDSFSTDKTIQIVKKYTKNIVQHQFKNYSSQYIWGLNNLPIKHDMILRLDADERWTKEGFHELRSLIDDANVDGVYVKMKIYFMGKWIKHGDFYPNYFLRVFKKSKSSIEDRWMDEHIHVRGKTIMSNIDVIEANYDRQRDISLWTDKHNKYSTREAVEYLINKHRLKSVSSIADLHGNKTERKRWVKENLYYKFPIFLRSLFYYFYRYLFKSGFRDGKEGFIFHFLHALWYRFLVDAKIYQIERLSKIEDKTIKQVIKELYGIDL